MNSTLVEEEIEEEIVMDGGEGEYDSTCTLVGVMIEEEIVGGVDQEHHMGETLEQR